MFVKDLYVRENLVVKAKRGQSVEEVYKMLKDSGYRCIPVVSLTGDYEGMIYKVHILEYFHENERKNEVIDQLITHQEKFIGEDEPFIQAVAKIKALPFLSVVEEGKFKGILTHNKVMGVLEDSFGIKTGGINFTVSSFETVGAIERLGKALQEENVEGFLTLDNGSEWVRRIVFTVKKDEDENQVARIEEKVGKSGFRIQHVQFI